MMYMILLKQIIIHIKISCDIYYNKPFLLFKNNLKKTWYTIKETLNRTNNTRDIPLIYHNDTIIQDSTELANAFN